MNDTFNKKKAGFYLTPETIAKIDQLYKSDNSESKSIFVEKAINFYCGYLTAENYKDYFSQVIVSTFKSSLDSFENRMASALFKNAIELSMLVHIIAATMEIGDENLDRVRGYCVEEVKKLHGVIKFENALAFQEGE